MKYFFLILTGLGAIISIGFGVYMFNLNNKINTKINDIAVVEKKIDLVDEKIKKKDLERKKIEEENNDKIKVLEVWEEELKKEETNNA